MRRTVVIGAMLLLTVFAHAVLAIQSQLNLKVKDYVTVTEFQDAGLTG